MTVSALPAWRLDAVDGDAMALWTGLLRDDNPIHVDAAAAEALGFGPRTVNPGPINLAYALNMLMAAKPDYAFVAVEARFLGNVLAGDAVEVDGMTVSDDDRGCRVEVRAGAQRTLVLHVDAVMESVRDPARR